MFLTRLNIFEPDNPYYVQGGKFNTFSADVQMPNCTAYAYLRMEEMMELTEPNNYLISKDGGFPNAKNWYKTTPLPKGEQMREGSIAVFDGNYGHVAAVEKILDSNHAIITQSQYDSNKARRDYKYWERRVAELTVGKATLAGIGKLIGFIYPPIADRRVKRDESKEQIEVIDDFVNVRDAANGKIKNAGCFCPAGIYNVLNSKEADGFVWYKLDSKCWVRDGDWLVHYPEPSNEVSELKREIASLTEKLKKIKEIVT